MSGENVSRNELFAPPPTFVIKPILWCFFAPSTDHMSRMLKKQMQRSGMCCGSCVTFDFFCSGTATKKKMVLRGTKSAMTVKFHVLRHAHVRNCHPCRWLKHVSSLGPRARFWPRPTQCNCKFDGAVRRCV